MRRARQVAGCSPTVYAAAREDARDRQGMGGWVAGGLLLPVVIPVIAHVTTPDPPAELAMQYTGNDRVCYTETYSSAAARRRQTAAWIGAGVAFGLLALAVRAESKGLERP